MRTGWNNGGTGEKKALNSTKQYAKIRTDASAVCEWSLVSMLTGPPEM